MECRRGLAMRSLSVCLSVRPSVCPSVKRVNCDKTEEITSPDFYTKEHLASEKKNVWWGTPSSRSSDEKSVCLSVCQSVRPSVKRVNCDKTEEISVQIFIPYERTFSPSFLRKRMFAGGHRHRGLAMRSLSVCLSVSQSVRPSVCQTREL